MLLKVTRATTRYYGYEIGRQKGKKGERNRHENPFLRKRLEGRGGDVFRTDPCNGAAALCRPSIAALSPGGTRRFRERTSEKAEEEKESHLYPTLIKRALSVKSWSAEKGRIAESKLLFKELRGGRGEGRIRRPRKGLDSPPI